MYNMVQPDGTIAVLSKEEVRLGVDSYVLSVVDKLASVEHTCAAKESLHFVLSLSLYTAAIQDLQSLPGYPLLSANGGSPVILNESNCPKYIKTFFMVWINQVPALRALSSTQSRVLQSKLCGCVPGQPPDPHLDALVHILKLVAGVLLQYCYTAEQQSQVTRTQSPLADAGSAEAEAPKERPQKRHRDEADDVESENIVVKRGRGRPKQSNIQPSLHVPESVQPQTRKSGIVWKSVAAHQGLWDFQANNLSPLPSGCKAYIWTASREDLCEILPELKRAQNDVCFEGVATPIVLLDDAKGSTGAWDGGQSIRLAMSRNYTLRITEPPGTVVPSPSVEAMHEPAALPEYDVVDDCDLKLITQPLPAIDQSPLDVSTEQPSVKSESATAQRDASATEEPPLSLLDEFPPEIHALMHARDAGIPVNVILCRGSRISPFVLPPEYGAVFLGFFFIVDIQTSDLSATWKEDGSGRILHGTRTWCFELEWTPGGEDPRAIVASTTTPWWAVPPHASKLENDTRAEEASLSIPLKHDYTLLPLHLLAADTQVGTDDLKGWHCMACGRLNVQRNFCFQKCGNCSSSSSLKPASIESVRQSCGIDPTTFPSDRCPPSLFQYNFDSPDGMRDFTYGISSTAAIHHLYTRNSSAVQAKPTQLFYDIQAHVELAAGSLQKRGGRGSAARTFDAHFDLSKKYVSSSRSHLTSSAVPDCVRDARDLMLLRSNTELATTKSVVIDSLSIKAWRRSGVKKGFMLRAKHEPVVILCLGADVGLSFFLPRATVLDINKAHLARISVDPSYDSMDHITGAISRSASPASDGDDAYEPDIDYPKTDRWNPGKLTEGPDVLMITLEHGDMLVAEGGDFRYILKKTGLSILLMNSS